jgi:hypothetical protein
MHFKLPEWGAKPTGLTSVETQLHPVYTPTSTNGEPSV